MDIPVIEIPTVYHIGTFNEADRGRNWKHSMEGHHLSVSLSPSKWRRVARLGDNPLHVLHKDGSGRFLDVLGARNNPDFRGMITEWGKREGFLVQRTIWYTWEYDQDFGGWDDFPFETRKEALRSLAEWQNVRNERWKTLGPNGGSALEERLVVSGTPALELAVGAEFCRFDGWDYAAMLWAEHEAVIAFDGVWWRDATGLRCPARGCIFKGLIGEWARKIVTGSAPDDDTLLAGMPETLNVTK